MRTAFIEELINIARKNDRIFLIVGDLGFSVVEPYVQEFPDRFLNAGVAEQNMTGVAAGLAKEGYIVFTYSIANFPSLRALEQIRYDVCYNQLNVNIVSVGAGFAYGSLGASHHATEDIGVMRSLPHMRVYSPSDPIETREVCQHVVNAPGPSYLRIGKAGEREIHNGSTKIDITKCIPVIIQKESEGAFLAVGSILENIFHHINENKLFGYDLFSSPSVKPINKASLISIAKKYSRIITVEEHQLSAGFGSAVIEILSDAYSEGKISKYPSIKRIGIPDKYYHHGGDQDFMRKLAGLHINVV